MTRPEFPSASVSGTAIGRMLMPSRFGHLTPWPTANGRIHRWYDRKQRRA